VKVYAKRNGVIVEAEVPDGAIYLEIGSTDDGSGKRAWPITSIDEEAHTYQRHPLGGALPFPERYYREDAIDWQPSKVGCPAGWHLGDIASSDTAS
jgi:hypothetical protein